MTQDSSGASVAFVPSPLRGLFAKDARVRKAAARDLSARSNREYADVLIAAFDAESDEEVLKWLGVAVATSASKLRAVAALEGRLARGVTNDNARDWIETALARVAGVARIGRTRKPASQLEGEELRRLLAKAWWAAAALDAEDLVYLASEHSNSAIRRRATLILHRRGEVLPATVVAQNLRDPDYLVREWTAHTQSQERARVLPTERLAEHFESENHPRVIEWLIPGIGRRSDAEDEWVIDHALRTGDPGVLESLAATFVPGDTRIGASLARELLEEAKDPVVLWRTIEHVSERPDVQEFNLDSALDRLAVHEGFETIATELTLNGMNPATIAVIERLSSDAGAQRVFSALNSREREGVMAIVNSATRDDATTIAVVIALREELNSFLRVFGTEYEVDRDASTGERYLRFKYSGPSGEVAVSVACNDRKGIESATGLAASILRHARPAVIVSLGISGSLNAKDVPLGCVVVGDTTEAYLANTKVQDDGAGGHKTRRAGETYTTDTHLANRLRALDLTDRAAFNRGKAKLAELSGLRDLVITRGPLAAGPSVVDSVSYREWMLEQQRDFKAVDMESAGVAAAAHGDGIQRARLVVLRGISDLAAAKAESDAQGGGERRSAAMVAASVVLATLLEAEYGVTVWS